MNKRNLTIMLIACCITALFSGCANNPARINYDNRMKAAFNQIQDGDSSEALENLQLASQIGQENGYDPTELQRLSVEAHLVSGNNVEAYSQAKTLLDADPEDAYANELMGKVLMKEGDYSEAEAHFVKAQKGYQASDDTSRITDLIALSRYFRAYEDGNPKLAERYLHEIQDADLQHSVDKAQNNVLAKSLN